VGDTQHREGEFVLLGSEWPNWRWKEFEAKLWWRGVWVDSIRVVMVGDVRVLNFDCDFDFEI